jgi:hypothetical protein
MIILLCILTLIFTFKEHFSDPVLVSKTPDIIDVKKMFDDIIVYNNDVDGRIGLDKCIEKCQGYCVEYGQTGTAYCYPVSESSPKDFNGGIIPNERKLAFPNVE